MEVNFQQTERAPVIPHRARDANVLDVGRNDAPFWMRLAGNGCYVNCRCYVVVMQQFIAAFWLDVT